MFKRKLVQILAPTLPLFVGCSGGGGDPINFNVPPAASNSNSAVVQDGVSCTVERVKMRDGVELHTETYRPVQDGKYPAVLIRNPYAGRYGEGCFNGVVGTPTAAAWAKNGYIGVLQVVRGTSSSGGEFTPFLQEQNDGYDTIEWAAKQSWSSGKVALHVGSYLGVTQWQAAITAPPSLAAFTPSVTPLDYRDDWVSRNGVYDLQFGIPWGLRFVPDQIQRKWSAQGRPKEEIDAAIADWNKRSTDTAFWSASLPLASTWDVISREAVPFVWDWLSRPNYDGYWASIDVGQKMAGVKVPALVSGGWYDLFAKGTIDGYLTIKQLAGTQAARKESMLVMDCCGHGSQGKNDTQITWGTNKTRLDANSVTPLALAWMNKYLKGDTTVDAEPRVQLTVMLPPDSGTMGDNFVLKTTDFPVPNTQYVSYGLSSGGNANTSLGDGLLTEATIASGSPDKYAYDPLNPVPTVGGNSIGQALDQSEVEKRSDVLVYTSAPITAAKAVIGKVSIKFWAATSATDTDFTAKLVDVHPDGYAHNVVDNIVRAKFRNGSKLPPVAVTPNTPLEYHLDLGYTATMFKPGHRIRVEISSSNFPHYSRNLNTGESENGSQTMVANQTIFHDAAMPSALILPIVPGVAQP